MYIHSSSHPYNNICFDLDHGHYAYVSFCIIAKVGGGGFSVVNIICPVYNYGNVYDA